jgi:hypothetical protein
MPGDVIMQLSEADMALLRPRFAKLAALRRAVQVEEESLSFAIQLRTGVPGVAVDMATGEVRLAEPTPPFAEPPPAEPQGLQVSTDAES